MPHFMKTMKDCGMRILVVMFNFQRQMVEMVCIHDAIDGKLVIMTKFMIKFIFIPKYVFEAYTKIIYT